MTHDPDTRLPNEAPKPLGDDGDAYAPGTEPADDPPTAWGLPSGKPKEPVPAWPLTLPGEPEPEPEPEPPPAPEPPPPAAVLEICVGGRRSERPLAEGTLLIGRPDPNRGTTPEIDMRPDDTVSRRHAELICREGRFFYRDLGSTNGSFLRGNALPPHQETELQPGDEVTLGESARLRLRSGG